MSATQRSDEPENSFYFPPKLFLDQYSDQSLCFLCRRINWRWSSSLSSNPAHLLGSIDTTAEVSKRQECVLCRLVLSILLQENSANEPSSYSPRDSSVGSFHEHSLLSIKLWYPSRGKLPTQLEAPGRIEIEVHHQGYIKGTIQTLGYTKERYHQTSGESYQDLSSFSKGPQSRISNQICIETVKEWLRLCEYSHLSCQHEDVLRRDTTSPYCNPFDLEPLTVIDVLDSCISFVQMPIKYVALSYVWGASTFLKATTKNIASLSLKGGLYLQRQPLPTTTNPLRETFNELNQIFSEATITLVALSGPNAGSALPGVRPDTRQGQSYGAIYGLELVVTPSKFMDILKTSIPESRAWTLQERLLSPRCLLFSDQEVAFFCQIGFERESGSKFPEDILQNPLTTLSMERIEGLTDENLDHMYEAYEELVSLYTQRRLSYQSDIENAFRGISNVLESYVLTPFVGGIPMSFLDHALLWKPLKIGRRTTVRSGNYGHAGGEPLHPTWSWMSWNGPVSGLLEQAQNFTGPRRPILGSDIKEFTLHEGNCTHLLEHFASGTEYKFLRPTRTYKRMETTIVGSLPETQSHPTVLLFRTHVINMKLVRIEADQGVFPQDVVLLKTLENDCCGFLYHGYEEMTLESGCPSRLILLSSLAQYNIFSIASNDTVFLPEFASWSSMYRPRASEDILNIMLTKRIADITERIAIGHIARVAWDTFGPREENIRLA